MLAKAAVSRVLLWCLLVVAGLAAALSLQGCGAGEQPVPTPEPAPPAAAAADAGAEGVRMIPIETPKGTFNVWTRKVGDNPTTKVLLLHGGPGATWDYLEPVSDALVGAGYEVYQYNQLGSYLSDQPDDPDLWTVDRFVDEVEQVRQALGLDASNFVLLGHSWGGILGLEYALAHGENLKGLVISNMMASAPAYDEYAEKVLKPQIEPAALAEIESLEKTGDTANPRYMELLMEQHYVKHILRRPAEQWPDAVNRAFEHLNPQVYVLMQGPSELGISGVLEHWDRTADLPRITVPTLVVGARDDTMDPAHMEWMAGQLPHGRYLYCPDGSHMAHYDDPEVYRGGLLAFVRDLG